jgi:hypothetical protein
MVRRSKHPWNVSRAKAWHLFLPPARPSLEEVAHYERLLVSEGLTVRPAWVLLGCTPELRSVAARYRRELLCVDQNPRVFAVLRSMVKPQYRERFLCAEWLQAKVPGPVDVVFGDGSINMLPVSQHAAFLRKVDRMLRPGGAALLRVHLLGPARFSTPRTVFEWYRSNARHEPVFSATRTDLDMLWVNRRTGRLNFPQFHRNIRQLYEAKIIEPEEFEAYDRLLAFNRINLYYTAREDFERLARRHFEIAGEYHGTDYTGSGNHPVYLLWKKGP